MSDQLRDPIPVRRTVRSDGVPPEFIKQTTSQNQRIIQKGVSNELLLRPQIVNEHMEVDGTIQDTVDSSTIVGQLFKASRVNMNGVTIKLASGNIEEWEDFESYADDAALRAVWVTSDAGNNNPVLKTTDPAPYEGSQYMDISYNWESDLAPTVTRTITSKDCRGGSWRFRIYPRLTWGEGNFNFFVTDGTNFKRLAVITLVTDEWVEVVIPQSAMIEDDAENPVDDEAITGVGLQVNRWTTESEGEYAGIDYIEFVSGGGTMKFKLWDCGNTIPEAGVNSIDDNTQYTTLGDPDLMTPVAELTLPLVGAGGVRRYQLDNFVAGLGGSLALTVGNYYMITMHYVDTDVDVYGSDGAVDNYVNGYSFTAPDEETAITAVGVNKDCVFQIYSAQDAYLLSTKVLFKTSDGAVANNGANSSYEILVRNADDTLESAITSEIYAGVIEPSVWFRPVQIELGGKIDMYFTDDSSDDVFKVYLIAEYAYEPQLING